MNPKSWKTLAIILLAVLILENLLIAYGIKLANDEDEKTIDCWYDVCEDYPEAEFDPATNVCYCYDYDLLDYPYVTKTEVLK